MRGGFPQDTEESIRAELFVIERLEQHAESLAAAQRVTKKGGGNRRLPKRLHDNGRVLLKAYRAIAAAIREERSITPAAEWLVDNFHVVEDQIREIRDDLPRGFYRQLPKLADGPLAGYPRVFGIAWAFVAHTDSRSNPRYSASCSSTGLRCLAGKSGASSKDITVSGYWPRLSQVRCAAVS